MKKLILVALAGILAVGVIALGVVLLATQEPAGAPDAPAAQRSVRPVAAPQPERSIPSFPVMERDGSSGPSPAQAGSPAQADSPPPAPASSSIPPSRQAPSRRGSR